MGNIKDLYENTELTQHQIAEKLGISPNTVYRFIKRNYSKEQRNFFKSIRYKNSKLGDNNPMKGKIRELCPHYVGDISDGKGYLMRQKPEWYTGRKGSKHVFVHHIMICEALGMTEIPKGWCVHHLDGNKTNNDLSNLEFMTISAHTRLHSLERATTRE